MSAEASRPLKDEGFGPVLSRHGSHTISQKDETTFVVVGYLAPPRDWVRAHLPPGDWKSRTVVAGDIHIETLSCLP